MWIPKVPRRWDFCGCPPCGLCFNWVEPRREFRVVREEDPIEVEEPQVIDGLQKMAEDLLGKPADQATVEEKVQVDKAALEIHERNILRAASGEPKEPEGGAVFDQEEDKWFEAAINEAGAARRAEKAYQEKLNKPKTLDQMDWGASEEAKGVEEEKKKQLAEEAEKEREKEKPIVGSFRNQREREQEAIRRLQEAAEKMRYR